MDEERGRVKRLIVILFVCCLGVGVVCFGGFVYLLEAYREGVLEGERIVTLAKIVALTGMFFLVLAFGYLLPAFVSHKKREQKWK